MTTWTDKTGSTTIIGDKQVENGEVLLTEDPVQLTTEGGEDLMTEYNPVFTVWTRLIGILTNWADKHE